MIMGSIGNPKAWVPYVNNKDCSQGFCSIYCPQWCYIIFPPPPPPSQFPHETSTTKFSPLIIAIIGILVSAFLLVSYYSIISKICGRRRRDHPNHHVSSSEEQNPSLHDQSSSWHAVNNVGLDEALIKSITVCKYKTSDGLIIDGSDCSVCLSEFEEDDNIKLLPKCSHAFHVPCIDTWLKSHSNCPLCRANVFFISAPSPPPPIIEPPPVNLESFQGTSENVTQDIERGAEEEAITDNTVVVEIKDDQPIRRSASMDHTRVSIADMLLLNQEEEEEWHCGGGAGSSKDSVAEIGKVSSSIHRKQVLHCCGVKSPVAMKRSFSSGRFFLSRQGRVRDTIIHL